MASLGISASFGSKTGIGITASAAQGNGNSQGQDQSWTNTHLSAGNTLTITSAGDTTLKGAVGTADRIIANSGNLHIESLQDTSTYQSQDHNNGGSLTVGISNMPVSGSFSTAAGNTQSTFNSVTEQSGLKAGDSGFQINVAGNTSLVGGVITSTDNAAQQNKNTFQSSQVTTADLQNNASYQAQSYAASISTSGAGAGVGNASGNSTSTTQSGISGIAGNKDARTGDKETGLQKIFDSNAVNKEVNAQVQITSEFGKLASTAIGNYAQAQYEKALANTDKEGIEQWKEGGTSRVLLHTLVGALTG
ncbi:hemagglutinin repeat-containing protein, partial [Undibacterium sp. SXout7W]|uniref:hemagglutinin repeat-containing protein n=1 Tax=Undibacterium sp. SXout7W TaxID=3413049 RepID=UPI003BF2075C